MPWIDTRSGEGGYWDYLRQDVFLQCAKHSISWTRHSGSFWLPVGGCYWLEMKKGGIIIAFTTTQLILLTALVVSCCGTCKRIDTNIRIINQRIGDIAEDVSRSLKLFIRELFYFVVPAPVVGKRRARWIYWSDQQMPFQNLGNLAKLHSLATCPIANQNIFILGAHGSCWSSPHNPVDNGGNTNKSHY